LPLTVSRTGTSPGPTAFTPPACASASAGELWPSQHSRRPRISESRGG
jgi:hypothetical protein